MANEPMAAAMSTELPPAAPDAGISAGSSLSVPSVLPAVGAPIRGLVRQRSVAVQRLRLGVSDKQPCSIVLQRLQILHQRSAESAVPVSQRSQRRQRRGLPMDISRGSSGSNSDGGGAEEADSSHDMFDDAAEYDGDAGGAEDQAEGRADEEDEDGEDGVLVDSPGVHLADCLLAVNESDNKLAIAHRRHLFIHAMHDKTTAIAAHFAAASSFSTPSAAPHMLDEYGEVSQEQRVHMEWAREGDAGAGQDELHGELAGDDEDSINVRLQRDSSDISALCWYRCEQRDWLLVGYRSGMLRCYHSNGRLAFAHVFHPSSIMQIKYFATANSQLSNLSDTIIHTGAALNKSSADERFNVLSTSVRSAASQPASAPAKHRFDVLVVHSDCLCVIGGKSIRAYLRVDLSAHSQFLSTSRRENIALSLHNLQQMKDGIWRHNKWKLKGQSVVEDAVRCDRLAALTMDELFAPPPSHLAQSESPCFLVAGLDPMLAYYSPAAEPFTLASAVSVAGQLGTMVASAVTSKVFGFAKSWFGSRAGVGGGGGGVKDGGQQSATNQTAAAAQSKKQRRTAPAPLPMPIIDLPVNRALRDATRSLTRIVLDPITGHYACCADSLGRVLLVESESMVAVRMWKGYREAKTAWIVQSNGAPYQPPQTQQRQQQSAHSALPLLSLYLLLYAPRRGLLELWAVPQGRRVGALSIGYGCVLIQRQSACTPVVPQRGDGSSGSSGDVSFDRGLLSVDWPAVDVVSPSGDIRRVDVTAFSEATAAG